MMLLNPLSKCQFCENNLWTNDQITYCSDCRVIDGEFFDQTVCIVCGNKLHEDDVPIIQFSKPQQTFDESCFKRLVDEGIIKLESKVNGGRLK